MNFKRAFKDMQTDFEMQKLHKKKELKCKLNSNKNSVKLQLNVKLFCVHCFLFSTAKEMAKKKITQKSARLGKTHGDCESL